ncbi:hypothetical protein [Streptomyces sp. NPDC052701]|uniref:hypothetical protein n=1 Tax=Streptomyces sp. NPDC052701 TaxID=3155533 RepID=UPI0034257409
MGERQSDGGLPGRRRVHPGGSACGHRSAAGPGACAPDTRETAPGGAALEALIAAALRGDRIDAEAERRAVAAFRAAREAGAHRARTRRRDDWRPRPRPRPARSVRAALSVALASLTLGGVAVAAIGVTGSHGGDGARDDRRDTRPPAASAGAFQRPDAGAAAPSGAGSARPDRPAAAQDTAAHCRAYERVEGRGRAMDATAWERLVTAAGGERNVAAYCVGRLKDAADGGDGRGRASTRPAPGDPADKGDSVGNGTGADNGADNGNGAGDGAADPGTGNAGGDPGGSGRGKNNGGDGGKAGAKKP